MHTCVTIIDMTTPYTLVSGSFTGKRPAPEDPESSSPKNQTRQKRTAETEKLVTTVKGPDGWVDYRPVQLNEQGMLRLTDSIDQVRTVIQGIDLHIRRMEQVQQQTSQQHEDHTKGIQEVAWDAFKAHERLNKLEEIRHEQYHLHSAMWRMSNQISTLTQRTTAAEARAEAAEARAGAAEARAIAAEALALVNAAALDDLNEVVEESEEEEEAPAPDHDSGSEVI